MSDDEPTNDSDPHQQDNLTTYIQVAIPNNSLLAHLSIHCTKMLEHFQLSKRHLAGPTLSSSGDDRLTSIARQLLESRASAKKDSGGCVARDRFHGNRRRV